MTDNLYKKVIEEDGVNPSILTDLNLFTNCPSCSGVFHNEDPPNLLKCGHFICNECKQDVGEECIVCGQKLKIKCSAYKGLLEVASQNRVTNKLLYNFILTTDVGGGQKIEDIPEEYTFEQILTKSSLFCNELARSKNEKDMNLIVRKAYCRYVEIKGVKLKDKIGQMGIQDNKGGKQNYNRISIINRYDGGQA